MRSGACLRSRMRRAASRSSRSIAQGDSQGAVAVEGNNLVWSFDRPARAGGEGEAVERRTRRDHRGRGAHAPAAEDRDVDPRTTDGKVETAGGGAAGFVSGIRAQEGGGRYSGRRIELDLKDADIHNILRLLADVGHVNIVTADDVGGNVTIRMNNVPWDQALDVVLSAKGLGMVRTGNLIRVAPLAQLQKERELRIAQQQRRSSTSAARDAPHPDQLREGAASSSQRSKELLSPRGSITVDERTNMLIARDIAGNLNRIEELVRSLDTQTPRGAHRGAHRRGDEQLPARRRHPVGRRHDLQRGDRATRPGSRSPRASPRPAAPPTAARRRPVSRRSRTRSRTRTSRSTCRPPSVPDKAVRSASRSARSTTTST